MYWIDGKPIYRKVINLGVLPNAATKTVNHNINNLDNIVLISGIGKQINTARWYPLPTTFNAVVDPVIRPLTVEVNNTQIVIQVNADWSSHSGTIILEYTKTID